MKKQSQNEKKLSLKKLQMTKINNMKAVYGGLMVTALPEQKPTVRNHSLV